MTVATDVARLDAIYQHWHDDGIIDHDDVAWLVILARECGCRLEFTIDEVRHT